MLMSSLRCFRSGVRTNRHSSRCSRCKEMNFQDPSVEIMQKKGECVSRFLHLVVASIKSDPAFDNIEVKG